MFVLNKTLIPSITSETGSATLALRHCDDKEVFSIIDLLIDPASRYIVVGVLTTCIYIKDSSVDKGHLVS